jgi:hypothetical protein
VFFKKKRLKTRSSERRRSPSSSQDQHRVISYYTASRRQLNNFTRSNPASGDRQLNRHLRLIGKWWFWLVTILATLVIVGYLLSLGSKPHIDIEGLAYRTPSEYQAIIETALKKDWQNQLKPLLKTDELEQAIYQLLPEAAIAEVSSSWLGHYPIVKITTHEPMALFNQTGQADMFISQRGKILLLSDQTGVDATNLVVIQNNSGIGALEGDQFISPDEAAAFIKLNNQFKAENKIVVYTITSNLHEISALESGRGYYVKFLLNDQIVRQFGALRATEIKLAEIGQTPSEYIDVRLADKAYYK